MKKKDNISERLVSLQRKCERIVLRSVNLQRTTEYLNSDEEYYLYTFVYNCFGMLESKHKRYVDAAMKHILEVSYPTLKDLPDDVKRRITSFAHSGRNWIQLKNRPKMFQDHTPRSVAFILVDLDFILLKKLQTEL